MGGSELSQGGDVVLSRAPAEVHLCNTVSPSDLKPVQHPPRNILLQEPTFTSKGLSEFQTVGILFPFTRNTPNS